ncbi:MAG: 16S rRNA (cytosine(967)-C(5))-methyltransferase RsmB [Firmicutes bacterium]|nr:16S rRNA (cytosine(967)-C(5))-methyltransferase RsmB [Bacillota bacterium]
MADKNRTCAYQVLWNIEKNGAFSNLALSAAIEKDRPDAPRLVRELVYGVLEQQILLDYTIRKYLKQPVSKLGLAEKIVLRMGIWQMDFANSIPEYAAVKESVDLARKVCRGREGFINGVLRNHGRAGAISEERPTRVDLPDRKKDPAEYLSVRYSCRRWIVDQWIGDYGEEQAEEMLKYSLETPDLVVRANLMRTTRAELKAALEALGAAAAEGNLSPAALHVKGSDLLSTELFKKGHFSVQDESSMLAVETLDPKPGETVIDICAAPGGKTLYMGERMENKGSLTACDVHGGKLSLISREGKRIGVTIPKLKVRDGAAPEAPDFPPESADKVLVDAPCSGLGVLRRKPEIKLHEAHEELAGLPAKQAAILANAAPIVKPGGRLVYSTCTVSKAENQQVTAAFLESHPQWEKETEIQLLPGKDGTDGFYICSMIRKKG